MKKLIVANWKSYKTLQETKTWFREFEKHVASEKINFNGEIILCPPFIDLIVSQEMLSSLPSWLSFSLGAQDTSPFEDGPYTGEVNANMLKDLVKYVIIGHSERRIYFKEDYRIINKKIKFAQKYGLEQIVCVSEMAQVEAVKREIPEFSNIFLYEPLFAIGSSQPDTPENAGRMAKKIKNVFTDVKVIYGGSVKAENVASFYSQPFLHGVAVGGASLDPSSFWEIVKYAAI